MAAVANNPKFAKKAGIPQTVGEDYMKADKKVMKYNVGGKLNMVEKNTYHDVPHATRPVWPKRMSRGARKKGKKARARGSPRSGNRGCRRSEPEHFGMIQVKPQQ